MLFHQRFIAEHKSSSFMYEWRFWGDDSNRFIRYEERNLISPFSTIVSSIAIPLLVVPLSTKLNHDS